MLTVSLFLGVYLAGTRVEKGDAVMQAQFDLMKLSYACSDPLYRTKRDSVRHWVRKFDTDTTFKDEDVSNLDSGLKNGTTRLSKPINKGDCITLLTEAQAKVDQLFEEFSR